MKTRVIYFLAFVMFFLFVSALATKKFSVLATDAVYSPGKYMVSGTGYNYTGEGARERVRLEVHASALDKSWLRYYNPGMNLTSTSITRTDTEGNAVTINGKGKVQGYPDYTFTAKIVDNDPDSFELKIFNPDGYLYYSADADELAEGDFVIVDTSDTKAHR